MALIMEAAHSAARDVGVDAVGTEHVLLALTRDPAGIAAQVLTELGVTEQVGERLEQIMAGEGYLGGSTSLEPSP